MVKLFRVHLLGRKTTLMLMLELLLAKGKMELNSLAICFLLVSKTTGWRVSGIKFSTNSEVLQREE